MKDFHALQFRAASIITVLAMVLYNYAPEDRQMLPYTVAVAGMAFVFGKFTNGFGSRKGGQRSSDTHAIVSQLQARDTNSSASDVALVPFMSPVDATTNSQEN